MDGQLGSGLTRSRLRGFGPPVEVNSCPRRAELPQQVFSSFLLGVSQGSKHS